MGWAGVPRDLNCCPGDNADPGTANGSALFLALKSCPGDNADPGTADVFLSDLKT